MGIVFLNAELTNELNLSLPSNNVRRYPSVLAVPHPNKEDIIILKTRFERPQTEALDIEKFEYYSESHGWQHDYSELTAKYVLLDPKLLNERGRKVLNYLIKN
jgi:hypothetical protein